MRASLSKKDPPARSVNSIHHWSEKESHCAPKKEKGEGVRVSPEYLTSRKDAYLGRREKKKGKRTV